MAAKVSPSQFLYGGVLGEGAYGRVRALALTLSLSKQRQVYHAAWKSDPTKEFAIKVIEKRLIRKENKVIKP